MNVNRERYQFGQVWLRKGVKEDVWYFRYYETGADGKRRRRNQRLGSTQDYPTKSDALRGAELLRVRVNSGKSSSTPITFQMVITRYRAKEMPERYSTRASYESILRKWISPQWGETRADDIEALEVEHWLRSLELAPKSKCNIRNLMHLLFECARRWQMVKSNPINLVRQSAKRLKTPRRLTPVEFQKLLTELKEPFRTMVTLAGCLGLRVGEILGLQWRDLNLLNGTLRIQRDVYQYRVDEVKTKTSCAALPLSSELVDILLAWRSQASYIGPTDYVFASDRRTRRNPQGGGPRGDATTLEYQIKPAAERAGIGKVGWHTFRHTYATVMEQVGIRMKVAQELLRHADIQTTMNVYTGTVDEDKRRAASLIAQRMLQEGSPLAESGSRYDVH